MLAAGCFAGDCLRSELAPGWFEEDAKSSRGESICTYCTVHVKASSDSGKKVFSLFLICPPGFSN